jgi:hypothetical protein
MWDSHLFGALALILFARSSNVREGRVDSASGSYAVENARAVSKSGTCSEVTVIAWQMKIVPSYGNPLKI